jgi:hypothetical protein
VNANWDDEFAIASSNGSGAIDAVDADTGPAFTTINK